MICAAASQYNGITLLFRNLYSISSVAQDHSYSFCSLVPYIFLYWFRCCNSHRIFLNRRIFLPIEFFYLLLFCLYYIQSSDLFRSFALNCLRNLVIRCYPSYSMNELTFNLITSASFKFVVWDINFALFNNSSLFAFFISGKLLVK